MQQKINKFLDKNNIAIVLVVIGVLGRLIPHVPNVTPLISMSMFAGMNLSRRSAFSSLFVTLFISDICLALLAGYPLIDYWMLFTYSGFFAIVLFCSKKQYSWKILPIYILISSLGFWCWTNFGVWLTSGLYPKTLSGLSTCYIAALPFLRNSLIGDMIWSGVIFGCFNLIVIRMFSSLKLLVKIATIRKNPI